MDCAIHGIVPRGRCSTPWLVDVVFRSGPEEGEDGKDEGDDPHLLEHLFFHVDGVSDLHLMKRGATDELAVQSYRPHAALL